MTKNTQPIGLAIRMRRRAARLTQEELAERAGLSRNYICQIEAGRKAPSLSALSTIARALHVRLGELIGEDYAINELRQKIDVAAAAELVGELKTLIRRLG
jgi:putative transcriptional regulator